MSDNILTQERLKELLNYDPETGVFVWIKKPANQINIGDAAGNLNLDGYRRICLGGAEFRAHRLAWLYMTGSFPPDEIDHINRDRADNRFANLRAATSSENKHNAGKRKRNICGYKGVSYDKHAKKWRAQIAFNRVLKHLGLFLTPEEASAAYLAAQKIYHPSCPTI